MAATAAALLNTKVLDKRNTRVFTSGEWNLTSAKARYVCEIIWRPHLHSLPDTPKHAWENQQTDVGMLRNKYRIKIVM
jgi:hypothetical protein